MTATVTPATVESPEEAAQRGLTPGRKPGGSPVKIGLSGEPTVQLLPTSIRDRAISRSRIRTGVLLVILGIILAIALFVVGTLRNTQAQAALQSANDHTTELIARQAKYAEAVKIDALITQIEELQKQGTSTEIPWGVLVALLIGAMPAGGQLLTVDAAGVTPWATMPLAADGTTPQIATITLTYSTLTVQEATAYSRSLALVPGFVGSTISNVAVGVDGRVTTKLTLVLSTDAVSGRFKDDKDATTDDAATPAPTDGATPAPTDAATSGTEG